VFSLWLTQVSIRLGPVGIFAQEANPHRGSDKVMRTNAVADLFKSGLVWAPLGLRWVEQVRDEMAASPHGQNDDLHDAAVYGLLRIRHCGLMRFDGPRSRISAAAADGILLRQVGISRFWDHPHKPHDAGNEPRCASYILDQIKKTIEAEEDEPRVDLEPVGTQKPGGRPEGHARYLEYAANLGWRRGLESNRRIETDPTDYESGCAASLISAGVHYQWVVAANQLELFVKSAATAWLRSWLWFLPGHPDALGEKQMRLGQVLIELVSIAAGGSGSALFRSKATRQLGSGSYPQCE
jgi:hypothetical protein